MLALAESLGANGREALAALIKGIEILPGIEYWRSATTVDAFGLHTVRKDATLGGDMRYMFRQPGSTRPYLGAGFAIAGSASPCSSTVASAARSTYTSGHA